MPPTAQEPGSAQTPRREIAIGSGVDVGQPPFVIAGEKGVAHGVQNLSLVPSQGIFSEKDGQAIVGGIGAHLHRAPVTGIRDLMAHRHLLNVGPVEGAAQR